MFLSPTAKMSDLGHCSIGALWQQLGKNPITIIIIIIGCFYTLGTQKAEQPMLPPAAV